MNHANNGDRYGFSQYRFPLSYQLKGCRFDLTDTNGAKYALYFADSQFMTFSSGHSEPELSAYQCLKLDDDTYFVSYGATLHTAVIDLSNGLAALIGEKENNYVFCTASGFPDGKIAPSFTDEMTGTAVRWVFGCNRYIKQIYCGENTCRCSWSPFDDKYRDAPTTYIKIKDGIYLCDVRRDPPMGADMPQGYGRLIMLQDFDHMLLVGCTFAAHTNERILVSAYGDFIETQL
jgi:hypothetical protein